MKSNTPNTTFCKFLFHFQTKVIRTINITYSMCVSVAFFVQHAQRMRLVILPSVACPTLTYLSTLCKKDTFSEKFNEHKIYSYILHSVCLRYIIIKMRRSLCTVPSCLSELKENLIFLTDFSKNTQVLNFVKISN
jgi:hypothetical protein